MCDKGLRVYWGWGEEKVFVEMVVSPRIVPISGEVGGSFGRWVQTLLGPAGAACCCAVGLRLLPSR